ncbi:hypothetical protein ACLK1Z_17295 [Escherichia coli]
MQQRKPAGLAAFSVLSCDNLPDNGHLTRNAVLWFCPTTGPAPGSVDRKKRPISRHDADRIVPAMTESQFALLETKTGYADPCGSSANHFVSG